jgi:hypothetical protein
MSKSKPKGPKRVKAIPIDQIRFLNPRVRNRRNFQEIVQSIANVGLKRPITVSPRKSELDSANYGPVCGQGRIACATKAAKSGKVGNVLDKVGQKMQGKKIVIWREHVAGLMRTDLAEAA